MPFYVELLEYFLARAAFTRSINTGTQAMRIKRLEIQGFKSFKDKTYIHFDQTITGIVGPNGCGKSNIVDAFFWVMGEQSYKHMRGRGSDDLIFNGSSKYTPLGLAEVTLVLESEIVDTEKAPAGASVEDQPSPTKTKEVSVTRRVYRGGEGEYFINGISARLRDIQELFMDTGVGAKGYSVIEQGQIGKIVNSKPEERRVLIEEAAGIAKYKARKKESLRKMEATQANLERLTDVIKEIERNLSSLERQAQKAKKYREHKKDLYEKEITWGRSRKQITDGKIQALTAEKDGVEASLLDARTQLQTLENELEVQRTLQLTESKSVEELQIQVESLQRELSKEEGLLELSHRRQEDFAAQIEKYDSEITSLEFTLSAEKDRAEKLDQDYFRLHSEHESLANSLAEKKARATFCREAFLSSRSGLDESRKKIMDFSRQLSSKNSDLAGKKAKVESLEGQLSQLIRLIEENQSEQTQGEVRFKDLEHRHELVVTELTNLRVDYDELLSRRNQLIHQLEVTKKQVNALKIDFAQQSSKLANLQELDSSHEGLDAGSVAALDWAKEKSVTHKLGPISDAFRVETGFEAAVEAHLGESLKSLMTDDESYAFSALDYLKKQNLGKTEIFWKVDSSGPSSSDFGALVEHLSNTGLKVIGPLSDFVTSQRLSITTLDAFFDCIVVESVNSEKFGEVAESATQFQRSIVTRDGVFFSRDGFVRGGSVESQADTSLLGRKRAIQDLNSSTEALAEQLQGLVKDVASLEGEKLSLDKAIEEKGNSLRELEISVAGLIKDLQQSRTYRDGLSAKEKQLVKSQQELSDSCTNLGVQISELLKIISELEIQQDSMQQYISQSEDKISESEEVLRIAEAELQAVQISEVSLRERATGLKNEGNSIRAQIADRESRLIQIIELSKSATTKSTEHSVEDQGIKSKIETISERLMERKQAFSVLRERLESATQEVVTAGDLSRSLRESIDQYRNRSSEVILELERLQSEWKFHVLNLEERYGVGCLDDANIPHQEEMKDPIVTEILAEDAERVLLQDIEELKERIRKMGEVNTMAIEEYDDIKKRHEYLDRERKDLETSMQNLQAAIDHINQTSEERFKKAFEAISDRFHRLFPIIFGGGKAELSVIYPEGVTDILECGIDILAQPPGKKIVNIGLLSGGEKALTAVSLIFAIFMVKPSPFCILDEVDAPLDDANIGRFNGLLKEMSARTQFILITHNKKTMELNDTLYGVTMEEPGVSKMVSIALQ